MKVQGHAIHQTEHSVQKVQKNLLSEGYINFELYLTVYKDRLKYRLMLKTHDREYLTPNQKYTAVNFSQEFLAAVSD